MALRDEIRAFQRRVDEQEYDNFKDLLYAGYALHARLPKGPSAERTLVEEILTTQSTKAAGEPFIAEYLGDILDPKWIRKPKAKPAPPSKRKR